jgi:hypothetical protein
MQQKIPTASGMQNEESRTHKMVTALSEEDEVKRNDMLQNAAVFLNSGDQPCVFDRSAYVIEEKTAA